MGCPGVGEEPSLGVSEKRLDVVLRSMVGEMVVGSGQLDWMTLEDISNHGDSDFSSLFHFREI